MGKSKKENKTVTKQRTEFLKCELTREEVEEAANKLATEIDSLTSLEEELKSVKADFKAQVEKSNAQVLMLTGLVRNKWQYRHIECDVLYDYTEQTVIVTRKDTGEVTEERAMSLGEKQMSFDFDEADEAA